MTESRDSSPANHSRRAPWRILIGSIVAVAAAAGLYWALACPCTTLPGLYLRGTEASEPVTDWTFANDVEVCQLQVDAGLLPHALNLNCMATSTGDLYVSCADCDGKRWSTGALANSQARLRLDGTVYPVTVTRVMDPAELDRAWNARAEKLHQLANPGAAPLPHTSPQEGWWSFHVVWR